MADPTDDELAAIRDEIPESVYDDDQVFEAWERLDRGEGASVVGVILMLLERQRAELVSSPLSLSIPGQISIGMGENVRALDEQMSRVRKGTELSVGQLSRVNRSRSSSGRTAADRLM